MGKGRLIWEELKHHLPFSILSVVFGLILVGILNFITEIVGVSDPSSHFEELFHVFHPAHILFSAIATTAMFWQREKKVFKTILVGIVGSLGICGISDIFMPYLSGYLLGAHMELHICIVQEPQLILPFLALGIVVGFLAPGTLEKSDGVVFSHSLHVLISAAASIMYLVSFGLTDWVHQLGAILIYMVLAVVIPCCTSDIIFPLACIGKIECTHLEHHHK
jgi:hypothetical protein